MGMPSPLHPVRITQIYLLQAARVGLIPREFLGFPVLPSAGWQYSYSVFGCFPFALAFKLAVYMPALSYVTAQSTGFVLSHVPAYAKDPRSIRPLSPPRYGLLLRKGPRPAHRPHLLLLRRHIPETPQLHRYTSIPYPQTSVFPIQRAALRTLLYLARWER